MTFGKNDLHQLKTRRFDLAGWNVDWTHHFDRFGVPSPGKTCTSSQSSVAAAKWQSTSTLHYLRVSLKCKNTLELRREQDGRRGYMVLGPCAFAGSACLQAAA